MTEMAETNAALRLFFSRLDAAPHPSHRAMSGFLADWRASRGGTLAPVHSKFATDDPSRFEFHQLSAERDYVLEAGSSYLGPLLGQLNDGSRLSGTLARRHAVRLRALFDFVLSTGEPVHAQYLTGDADAQTFVVDLLVVPLADQSGAVDHVAGKWRRRPIHALERHSKAIDGRTAVMGLGSAFALASACASQLGLPLTPHEARQFDDGEVKMRALESVRGRDVFIFADLWSTPGQSVHDKLCRALFLVGAVRQAAARSATIVAPYLCYARKDRQTQPRDPLTLRYVAQLFEAVGTDCLITVTAHNLAAFQNAFRCETRHLDLSEIFVDEIAPTLRTENVVVVSPDPGGEKRAESFRRALQARLDRPVGKVLIDKVRALGVVSGTLFAGSVEDATVIIVDDMISTGTTMLKAAEACRSRGAAHVIVLTTHGLFINGFEAFWKDSPIDEIWLTDSIPLTQPAEMTDRIHIIPLASPLADMIRHRHPRTN